GADSRAAVSASVPPAASNRTSRPPAPSTSTRSCPAASAAARSATSCGRTAARPARRAAVAGASGSGYRRVSAAVTGPASRSTSSTSPGSSGRTPVCAAFSTATDRPAASAAAATAAVTTVLPTSVPVPVTTSTATSALLGGGAHRPGDPCHVDVVRDERGHGVDQVAERPQPDPLADGRGGRRRHVDRAVELDDADGAEDPHVTDPRQIRGRSQPLTQPRLDP